MELPHFIRIWTDSGLLRKVLSPMLDNVLLIFDLSQLLRFEYMLSDLTHIGNLLESLPYTTNVSDRSQTADYHWTRVKGSAPMTVKRIQYPSWDTT